MKLMNKIHIHHCYDAWSRLRFRCYSFLKWQKLVYLLPGIFLLILFSGGRLTHPASAAQEKLNGNQTPTPQDQKKPSIKSQPLFTIEESVMCEDVENMEPVREAIVFPVEKGHIICFTSITNIKKKTYIIHRWIHSDEVITTKRLKIRPPYWKTYSKIQLRETDKGPWRVEIVDAEGRVLRILRFSVTD